MSLWDPEIIVGAITAIGVFFGIGKRIKSKKATTEIIDLALRASDLIVETLRATDRTATAETIDEWSYRFRAVLDAWGVEATRGQWSAAVEAVQKRFAEYNLLRAEGTAKDALRKWRELEQRFSILRATSGGA